MIPVVDIPINRVGGDDGYVSFQEAKHRARLLELSVPYRQCRAGGLLGFENRMYPPWAAYLLRVPKRSQRAALRWCLEDDGAGFLGCILMNEEALPAALAARHRLARPRPPAAQRGPYARRA